MVERLFAFMKNNMGPEYVGHDYDHSVRVHRNAMLIAKSESCDMQVVEASAIVHDYIDEKFVVNYESQKEILQNILVEVGLTQSQVDHVFDIIEHMSYSKHMEMKTLEGKIVQDADRLDALGAIGIARCFAYGGSQARLLYGDANSSVQHFHDKLFKLKYMMNTSMGKVLAIERHEFMTMFLDQLNRELR